MKNKQQFEIFNIFKMFISQARQEIPPGVDVSDSVLARLTSRRGRPVFVSDKPLMWLAALSSAVAVPAVVLAALLYNASVSPLAELVESISWVMQ